MLAESFFCDGVIARFVGVVLVEGSSNTIFVSLFAGCSTIDLGTSIFSSLKGEVARGGEGVLTDGCGRSSRLALTFTRNRNKRKRSIPVTTMTIGDDLLIFWLACGRV